MLNEPKLTDYLPQIKLLSETNDFHKSILLTESFLLEKEKDLTMYYAPHNEYIETRATVVLVGITPGFHQMKTALQSVAQHLSGNFSTKQLVKQAKIDASLSGPMRNNIVQMLDACDLPKQLQIKTSAELFTTKRSMLHTTSIIKYPVFYKGKNYTGHQPKIHQSPMLKRFAYEDFPKEIHALSNPTIIIPLGKVVDHVLTQIKHTIHPKHLLIHGFPHPSGANGHRKKQFAANKEWITSLLRQWDTCKQK